MILADLKRYLETRGQTSLAELARHFRADPEALRGMLETWIRKGRVTRLRTPASCGSRCSGCDPLAAEVYVWRLDGEPSPPAGTGVACDRLP